MKDHVFRDRTVPGTESFGIIVGNRDAGARWSTERDARTGLQVARRREAKRAAEALPRALAAQEEIEESGDLESRLAAAFKVDDLQTAAGRRARR